MQHTTIAVDLAKSVFEIAVSRHPGKVAEHLPVTVLMEACGSAHHWGRQLESLGHRVLLLPPHRTRPCPLCTGGAPRGSLPDREDQHEPRYAP